MTFVILLYFLVFVRGWDCRDTKCRKESIAGEEYRQGFHRVNYHEETPYITAFEDLGSNEVFCLGVLISKQHALTTMVCMHTKVKGQRWQKRGRSFKVLYGDGTISQMQKNDVDYITFHQRCSNKRINDVFWEDCDFAVVKTFSYFNSVKTAVFPSTFADSAKSELDRSIMYNRYCIGVGFGKYEVWTGKTNFFPGKHHWHYDREGTSRPDLYKFDMRLLHDVTCSSQFVDCCISNAFDKNYYRKYENYFKNVNCVARGKKLSQCFGESGGPVICDGYVFGLIKGTTECPAEKDRNQNTDIRGYMIFVGIHNVLDTIRDDYDPSFNADNRPVPSTDPFGVAVDFDGKLVDPESRPVLPPNITQADPRTGNGTGEDAYGDYYSSASINSSIFSTIVAILLQFSL